MRQSNILRRAHIERVVGLVEVGDHSSDIDVWSNFFIDIFIQKSHLFVSVESGMISAGEG